MDRSDGCGRPNLNATSRSPFGTTACTLSYQDLRGFLRNLSASLPCSKSMVHFTSLAVNGLPSCHFTPGCSLKVRVLPPSPQAQLSASSGRIVSGLFWAMC